MPRSAVDAARKAEQRDRVLPARLVVYDVLALATSCDASYEEVMGSLDEGLSSASG